MPKPKPTLEGPLTGPLDLRSLPDQLEPGTVRMRQNLQTVAQGRLRRGTGFSKFLSVSDYNNSDFHDQLLFLNKTATLTADVSYTSPNVLFTATAGSPHGLATGDSVQIPVASSSVFIGTFVVTVTSSTVFTCPLSASDVASHSQSGVSVYVLGRTRAPLTLMFEAESTRRIRSLIVGNQQVLAQLNQHNGSYRILGSGFGGNPSTSAAAPRFKAARLGDYVLFTNDFDKVQYMVLEQPPDNSGNYLSTIPDLDTIGLSQAAVIWEWRNVIFLADVVMDGDRFSYRIVWSDFKGPIRFDPSALDSITGFKDLFTRERILAGAPAGNSFLIYTTHGIWEIAAVGGEQSFDFRRVYNAEAKDGSDTLKAVLAYPNSLCNLHDAHAYIGHDGIYLFNQYYSTPSRPEWLHKASADLFSKLDPSLCNVHVGAGFGDEMYWSIASVGSSNQCPDYTLRANKTYETCDVIDHGFLCFCQNRPQDMATVRDFIVENEICTLAGLASAGYPYGKENLPRTLPTGNAAFTPDCIYQTARLAVVVTLSDGTTDTIHVEDYTQGSAAATSLCALLGGVRANDICGSCEALPLFLAASSTDWCIKELGKVFYREMCQNPTGAGTSDSDGYSAAVGSYTLDEIISIIRFSPTYGIDERIKSEGLELWYVAVAQDPPSTISLRVGISAQPADPNTGEGMVWHQHSSKNLAYVTQRNQSQHLAANTQPSQTLKWRYDREGRILYFELTIGGTGGDASFSRIAADLRSTGRTNNY